MTEAQTALVPYTCPVCKGVLRKEADHNYRCPVGHVYTRQTLITSQSKTIEASLWTAIRTLEEQDKVSYELINDEQADPWVEKKDNESITLAVILRGLLVTYPLPH